MYSKKSFVVATIVFFFFLSVNSANSQIRWQQPQFTVNPLISTTSTVQTSFISDTGLSNAQFRVVPELAPYVSVFPSSFNNIPAGQSIPVQLIISIPKNTPVQTISGTIHLIESPGPGRTYPRPLPITLNLRMATAFEIPNSIAPASIDRIVTEPDLNGNLFVKDAINIFFKPNTPQGSIISLVAQINGVILGSFPDENMIQVQVNQEGFQNISNIINSVSQNPNVELAMHHYLQNVTKVPNDLGFQFSYGANLIELPAAWDITTGNSAVRIGVLDSAFDNNHIDLINNIARAANNTVSPNVIFHGTHVTGIIAAKGNNTQGIAGTMWNASLYLYSASDPNAPRSLDDLYLMIGMNQAVRDKVRVLNLSLGLDCKIMTQSCAQLLNESDAFYSRFIQGANRNNPDMLWVFSAGNGKPPDYQGVNVTQSSPARLSISKANVISVSAVDSQKRIADFSMYGSGITVAAPGVNILSLAPSNVLTELSGTSMAAPYVTGVAGLLLSADSHLTGSQIKQIIQATAENTGNTDRTGNPVILLDAYKALQRVTTPPSQWLSFIEGNPGLPGDGITINIAGGGRFPFWAELSQPIPLAGKTNGISTTVFTLPASPQPTTINVIYSKIGDFDNCSFGIANANYRRVVVNGVQGVVTYHSQQEILNAMQSLNNFRPACGVTLNNSQMEVVHAFNGGSFITVLDAVTAGEGPNGFPGVVVP